MIKTRIVLTSLLVTVTMAFVTTAVAQEVRKTMRDYVTEPCRPYSPDDPCQRSKWYRLQTGHFGFAYNCDGEECKRNSPYLYWTAPTNRPLPPYHRWLREARCDLREALGRVADGNCASCETACGHCGGSGCAVCQNPQDTVAPAVAEAQHIRIAEYSNQGASPNTGRVSLAELFASRESEARPVPAAVDNRKSDSIRTASTIEDLRSRYPRASQIGQSERAPLPNVEQPSKTPARSVNPIAPSRQRLFR